MCYTYAEKDSAASPSFTCEQANREYGIKKNNRRKIKHFLEHFFIEILHHLNLHLVTMKRYTTLFRITLKIKER